MTRHLVVCEGTRTEPRYFNGLKAALGVRRADAVENADRLDKHHLSIGSTLPSSQNPGTKVRDIFDEVGPYLEEDK